MPDGHVGLPKEQRQFLANMILVQIEQMKMSVAQSIGVADVRTVALGNHSRAEENAFVIGNHLFGKRGMVVIDTEWLDAWGRAP